MIKKISMLVCDSCGHQELIDLPDTNRARIEAANDGWKFMSYQGLQVNGRSRARQWDSCMKCVLPQPEIVTQRLIEDAAAKT